MLHVFSGQTKRPATIAVAYMPQISGRQNIMLTRTVVRVNVNGLTLDAQLSNWRVASWITSLIGYAVIIVIFFSAIFPQHSVFKFQNILCLKSLFIFTKVMIPAVEKHVPFPHPSKEPPPKSSPSQCASAKLFSDSCLSAPNRNCMDIQQEKVGTSFDVIDLGITA